MGALQGVQLSGRESTFVHLLARRGYEIQRAATEAGYHPDYGWQLIRKPAVALAVHEALQLELCNVLAPAALNVAALLLRDESVSARVRADVAFKFLSLAGHVAPNERSKGPEKQISEMSREELFAYIARNEAEIQKIEGELAERATDVSAPVTRQPGRVVDAKPLDYLD